MDAFTKETVLAALSKMFTGGYFDICTIDKCLKLTRSIPNGHDYDCLSALHCVHWKDMSPDLRKTVFDTTIKMMLCDGFDLSALEMIFDEEKKVFELHEPKKSRFRLLG